MGQDARLESLRHRHEELEHRIEEEENRPLPDQNMVHTLKKQKLKVKDELHRISH
jgi:uncharacterized protein YdcH (DUF465 family)